jgi:hypothetical protein
VHRLVHVGRSALRIGLALTVLAGASTGVVLARGTTFGPASADQAATAMQLAGGDVAVTGPAGQGAPFQSDVVQVASSQAAAAQDAAARTAAAQAAAAQAAAAQAATQRKAAADKAARDAARDPRSAARLMLTDHGWGSGQFSCLDSLWTKESGWNPQARNASSGAFGIPQALPGGKMSSAGADWQTNPVTQIRWGLQYIADSYGSPCSAWAHSRAMNWY